MKGAANKVLGALFDVCKEVIRERGITQENIWIATIQSTRIYSILHFVLSIKRIQVVRNRFR